MEVDAYENVQAYKGGLPDISLQLHATEAENAVPEVRPEPPRPDEGAASRSSGSSGDIKSHKTHTLYQGTGH